MCTGAGSVFSWWVQQTWLWLQLYFSNTDCIRIIRSIREYKLYMRLLWLSSCLCGRLHSRFQLFIDRKSGGPWKPFLLMSNVTNPWYFRRKPLSRRWDGKLPTPGCAEHLCPCLCCKCPCLCSRVRVTHAHVNIRVCVLDVCWSIIHFFWQPVFWARCFLSVLACFRAHFVLRDFCFAYMCYCAPRYCIYTCVVLAFLSVSCGHYSFSFRLLFSLLMVCLDWLDFLNVCDMLELVWRALTPLVRLTKHNQSKTGQNIANPGHQRCIYFLQLWSQCIRDLHRPRWTPPACRLFSTPKDGCGTLATASACTPKGVASWCSNTCPTFWLQCSAAKIYLY